MAKREVKPTEQDTHPPRTDMEKLEAIEKEISLVYDDLELFEEEDKKYREGLKTEWKVLYRIGEIIEK